MNNKVKSFPDINPFNFFKSNRYRDPILSSESFYLYASGRAAIYFAMLHSQLPPGSIVLLPSFHCGVEVEAILRAGYKVAYYRVDNNMAIDFEDLGGRITNETKALFIIHYFGFPQELEKVKELCVLHNLMLLEDCAHSLYSKYDNKWLGTFGAYGFFSIQKMIGVPNGGGLLCNLPYSKVPESGKQYLDKSIVKKTIKSILEFWAAKDLKIIQFILNRIDNARQKKSVDKGDEQVVPLNYYDVPMHDYHHAISGLSKPLLRTEVFTSIVEKRIHNYHLLRNKINNHPSVKVLEYKDGVCPLCLVVYLESRDEVEFELNKEGIYPFVFGKTPHISLSMEEFPDTKYLNDSVLGLPIHQQLNEGDIERVASVFNHVMNK